MEDESTTAESFCVILAEEMRAAMDGMTAMKGAQFEKHLGTLDRQFGQFYRRLEACRRYLDLHRPPKPARFSFGEAFHKWNPSSDGVVLGFEGKEKLPLIADSRQILLCLDLISINARQDTSSDFEIRVHAQSHPPNVLVHSTVLLQPDAILTIGHGLAVNWSTLAARWTAATQGGPISTRPDGDLVMDLRGDADWEQGIDRFTVAEDKLRRAERAMMPWRGATGDTQTGYADPDEVPALYASHLQRTAGFLEEAAAVIRGGTPQ